MELKLPAPCLVVLIGPSGAGKTTWAHRHFADHEVVSSDEMRARVGIDESDMSASTAAFELLERIVTERLGRRLTTVIDTTGLDPEHRRDWVGRAHAAHLPAYAILFETDLESIEPHNRRRPHPVPKSVLRKQLAGFVDALSRVGDEGFDQVYSEQPVRAVTATLIAPAPTEPPPTGHTFGLLIGRFDWAGQDLGEQLSRIAGRAEETGFTDLWFMDHFRQIHSVGRPWEDIPEAYATLSYVAASTSRVRLGVLVTAITHRHPVVLGKMLATLDVLSGGRAICGLGVGWDRSEHAAYGIELPPLSDRYDLLEDTLQMLPLLWGKGTPAFEGKTFTAKELVSYPRPIQDPIPIMVGGSGERKTLRLVARYANACNLFGDTETIRHKVGVLARHCAEFGRDPSEIEVTHLVDAMVATDQADLRNRIDRLRGRSQSREEYACDHNAGLVEDLAGLFASYADAGADHSIVSLPDLHIDGSIEAFGDVIARLDVP